MPGTAKNLFKFGSADFVAGAALCSRNSRGCCCCGGGDGKETEQDTEITNSKHCDVYMSSTNYASIVISIFACEDLAILAIQL